MSCKNCLKDIYKVVEEIKEFAQTLSLSDFKIEVELDEDVQLIFINHNIEDSQMDRRLEQFMANKMDEYFYSKQNYDVSIGYDYLLSERVGVFSLEG